MPDPTPEEKFFLKLAGTQGSVASLIESTAPAALVYPELVVEDDEKWAALLRSTADSNAIHCIQVYFQGLTEWGKAPAGCMNPLLILGVSFLRGAELGTGSIAIQQDLLKEIAMVKWAIGKSTHLGMNDTVDPILSGCVARHRGLSVPNLRQSRKMGRTPVIVGVGRLEIEMQTLQLNMT